MSSESRINLPRITLPSTETLDIAATYLRKEKLEAERDELVREFSGLQTIGRSAALTKVMDTVRAAARLLRIKPHSFRKRAKEKFGL